MRELPIGQVTFLFTDVEGSTRLLERLGARFRDVQDRHDAILRAAIAAGDGRELSTEGDSFFAVFPTPDGAVRAAARAQRQLAAAAWPDETAVSVRMGIHTGEGIPGGANYLGLDVNRTARIATAAHGGQVLLSGATRSLVDDRLPPATRLLDLGQHRLRDLLEPEHLYQLAIDGLKQDFPAPRTLDARPNNLPAQLTRFIGRADEIAGLRQALNGNRLVTLTGPGGTGKTRLSLQVAAEVLAEFRDGVFFIDLSALTDADLVSQEIASTLRVRAEPGRALLDSLSDHLREKELLLVLDNFEQVLDAGPEVLEPLLRAAAGLKALVTSRVPLHLYGEHQFAVPPLALANVDRLPDVEALLQVESLALFAERAAAGSPGFRITPQNARSVAEIASRLDGLPLAIELAASRIRVLSPEQLLARLEHRLPLLQGRDRNLPERQRTLRRTIEWSYDLLDEAERRMFSRLSVFAGGADLGAVQAVANPDGELGLDTLDGLASLVDRSLVRRVETDDGEPRFVMLETIREFGLEQLAASKEESVVRRRHAEHSIAVAEKAAESLFGAEQVASRQRLERDHDNFRSAMSWILRSGEAEIGLRLGAALREFVRVGSHAREGARWLEEVLALPGASGRTHIRARALIAAADAASWIGEMQGAAHVRIAEEALAIYRELDDANGIADALEERGVALLSDGQADAGRASLEEARERQMALGNRQKAGECTTALGLAALVSWQPDQARAHFEEALATFHELRDSYWIAFAQRLLGGAYEMSGDLPAAEQWYRASLVGAQQHGILTIAASVLSALAHLTLTREQHERALRLIAASDAIRDVVGDAPPMELAMIGDVRGLASALLDPARAEAVYQEGQAMELDDAVSYALRTSEASRD